MRPARQPDRLDRLSAEVGALIELALRLVSLETGRSIEQLRRELPSSRRKPRPL
ncbi:MAG: hypothetical protein ACRYFX_12885 [Janthinobacterium lividum]